MHALDDIAAPLVDLGRMLRAAEYRFVTVTPETHRRVMERDLAAGRGAARSLRDVFGWSRAFAPSALPAGMLGLLRAARCVEEDGEMLRATVRFSTLGARLFVHSAYPTLDADAVFFGPDTYRFCALLARCGPTVGRLVDIGCGTGAGGLTAGASEVVLSDVNERALRFARVNAALADVDVEVVRSDVLAGVEGPVHRVVANPPYMLDVAGRAYRDGGGAHGEGLAVRIVEESLARLSPGGTLVLYTGAAIVDGEDTFLRCAAPRCREAGARFTYEELDPDVFGDELDQAPYAAVERIAAVALVAMRP